MSWFTTGVKAIGGFFGGKGGGKVMEFADDAHYSAQERSQDGLKEMEAIRATQFEGLLGTLVTLYKSANTWWARLIILIMIFGDVLIALAARAVRPWVTIELVGHLFGHWTINMPEMSGIQETLTWIVFTFWFGGRTIMKDIPTMLKAIRKK
jgi:hypothetical protein